ncbi:MAG: restriction endonuclease subunit M [Candidatus Portnoybacteria bacterium CG_4_10_14_0_8_um_filter_40_50]|uniref:Restriction endonuclease subunit M n=1 Tax=Candidatus Portnoybacteria bacterium CG_4_10_14_0_8_um_filter_40_50 TaxID=1974800 RepID=A0A2M7QPR0_9BACT|nr:MAG: restriction endonuclease subunit M [Candidatus Portnoybacteria bacterium CG_4_10_14_0_8_um_filter_40_50]
MPKKKQSKTKESRIKIEPPKGRPMLYWVGKKPLEYVKGFPAKLKPHEVFDPLNTGLRHEPPIFKNLEKDWQNLLFHGDNKEVLATLLENGFRGKVDLIYIDPPFMSGADYIRKVELRGIKQTQTMVDDASLLQQTMYFDIWKNDAYLQFMYERLILLRELLSNDGVFYLHCDDNAEHHLRMLMDEVFGPENFLNWIAYRTDVSRGRKKESKFFGNNLNMLFIYTKDKQEANKRFNPVAEENEIKDPLAEGYLEDKGRFFSTSDPGTYTEESLYHLAEEGRLFITKGGKFKIDKKKRRVIIKGGSPRVKYYLIRKGNKFFKERIIDNVWEDLLGIANQPGEATGFATQKVEGLLERVIRSSSKENDLVLDCFIGSGTTAVAAQNHGRRWIGCDINKGAIQTTSKRLQKIILDQIKEKKDVPSYSFGIYQVNDYDLKLLRTEAIELAIEHIGIERRKTDSFFDGTLGKELVKIIDFNHPLTLLDLQLLEDEIKKRPDEERNIVLVCLGKELVADPWIEEWDKKHPVNKIRVIELRTDKKYGKFLLHQPAMAKVKIERKGDKAIVDILDFNSPTIIERLNDPQSVFKVKIPDFRAMIDVALIDTAYDGKTFRIVHSDVPEKKSDYIVGHYELEIPKKKTKVAVKIIDMLGEEVIEIKEI